MSNASVLPDTNGDRAAYQRDPATAPEDVAARFEVERSRLFAIAYRMLGSAAEAEDAVQNTYLRFCNGKSTEVRSDQAFLTTVLTRICLDDLKSARARRETYIGPWLPEPVADRRAIDGSEPEHVVEQRESISMAFLVLLESLTPTERAIFLLHEVFDYSFREVSRMVGKRDDACRQEFHRAKQHVVERRPRYHPTDGELERLTQAFIGACALGDVDGLKRLLAEDVTVWSDGGGKVAAARKPVHGRDAVARLWIGLVRRFSTIPTVQVLAVNGGPGILVSVDGSPYSVITVDGEAGQIHAIYAVVNPDKIGQFRQAGQSRTIE